MEILRNNRGQVLIYVSLFLVLLTLLTGLAIDVGWMAYVRSQSQTAIDAAALSGAAAVPAYNQDGSTGQIKDRVEAFNGPGTDASSNNVMNQSAGLNGSQVNQGGDAEVIIYNSTTDSITAPANPAAANGVRVGKGFNTPLFFARLLNGGLPTTINVTATAVMRVRPSLPVNLICPNPPGACPPPPGSQIIMEFRASPSPQDNHSFTSYFIHNASASVMKDMVLNPSLIPCVSNGDPIELNNGQMNSLLEKIKDAWNKNKKPVDLDNNPYTPPVDAWPVLVPVVSINGNPNQSAPIMDFRWIAITNVVSQGSPKTITAIFGGGNLGLSYCGPHLVR
jgi:Flp pilus assembly protein TadG